ncbi:hypothetical protein D3C72_1461350 [compost metagenome]
MNAVGVQLGKLVRADVRGDEQRGLAADEPALLHRGAVAVVQDVHISQVFQRRLIDAGVVVLGAIEAEQDVVEGPAVLVERRKLREGVAILCVDTLEIPAFDQQKHPVLGISGAFQAVRAECRHAL